MRNVRDLLPPARAAHIFELVLRYAGFALFELSCVLLLLSPSGRSQDLIRLEIIAVLLGVLSISGSVVVKLYSTRIHRPGSMSDSFPSSPSWQSQLRAIALAAILPICALLLAVIIPVTSDAYEIVFPLGLIGGVTLLVTCMAVSTNRSPAA